MPGKGIALHLHRCPRTACLWVSLCICCTEVGAHHFPPGLDGALLTLPVDGFAVEVLILPAIAEVDRTTGILISIRQTESEHYFTGPVSVAVSPAEGSEGGVPVALEAKQRSDLKGDREARHIFRQPGSYVMTIGFRPGEKPLSVEVPLEVTRSAGPSVLMLGVVVAVLVGAIFAIGLLKRTSGNA